MSQTEIIKALEDYMHASLGVNGEITRRAKEAIEALKASCSETPNNSKWVRVSADRYTRSSDYIYKCSKCGEHTVGMPRSCPNCGAQTEVRNGNH